MAPLSKEKRIKRAHELLHGFELNDGQLKRIITLLNDEFDRGLQGEQNAGVSMLITFVRDVPTGNEIGKYMALDLGGTNFRVLTVELDGEKAAIDTETCEIPESLMIGPGRDLFDHIAFCVYQFIASRKIVAEFLPIGFTFSFPCLNANLASAKLIKWTKGFKCADVEGEDIAELLRGALIRKRPKGCNTRVDIVAVINDTTGTLMSCAHRNRNCRVGIIVGTGTNCCYMEKLECVKKWPLPPDNQPKQVIINCEWGAFGDNGRLAEFRTIWDQNVDTESLNPGSQLYEKMNSGMYLGEVTRQIIITFHSEGILFVGSPLPDIAEPRTFSTKHLSRIASKQPQSVEKVFQKMQCKSHDQVDVELMEFICKKVITRAAHLISAGCACVLDRIDREHTTIGYDGSVLRYHPTFRQQIEDKLKQLSGKKFNLMLSEDGSGRGAALVAAVAWQKLKNSKP